MARRQIGFDPRGVGGRGSSDSDTGAWLTEYVNIEVNFWLVITTSPPSPASAGFLLVTCNAGNGGVESARSRPAKRKTKMDSLKYLAALVAVCCAAPVYAQNRAVEELNYRVGGSYSSTRNDDDPWRSGPGASTGSVGASVTMPLAKYLGATVSGSYGLTRTPFGPVPDDPYVIDQWGGDSGVFKTNSSDIGVALFLRDFDIGKLGAGYARGRNEWASYAHWHWCFSADVCYDEPATYTYGPIDIDTTRVFADYYFRDLTASAEYIDSRYSSVWGMSNSSLYTVGATYYPLSNLSVRLALHRQPAEDEYSLALDSQSLTLEYQPEILGESTSFTLQLGNQEYSRSAMVGVTFFFDKRVDLITRDRRYR